MSEYPVPRRVRVRSRVATFEAPIMGLVANGVWIEAQGTLPFRTSVELDFDAAPGAVLTFAAEVVSSTPSGMGFEVLASTPPEALAVLAAWSAGQSAVPKEPLGARPPRPPRGVSSPYGALAGVRVLVVEDEEAVAVMLELALKRRGAIATWARNGADALELLSRGFDAVLLDWMLPRVSGDAVLEKIQATHPRLPVAIVSGAACLPRTRNAMLKLGARNVFSKPFRVRTICDWVEQSVRPGKALLGLG